MEDSYPWLIVVIVAFVVGFCLPSDKILGKLLLWMNHTFGIKCKLSEEDVTEEEILSMVNEGHEQGVLEANEAEMISNIFEMGEKEAKDIMQHRVNVLAVDGNETLDKALEFMLGENKSRYPVYNKDLDDVMGILHLRDAFTIHNNKECANKKVKEIEGLVREALLVPETKNIHQLFRIMQKDKQQMAIVMDEYGQMSGIITLEDILEEIVGNIMDEYDEEEEPIHKLAEESFMMDGLTQLDEIEDVLGIEIEEDFDTLNGLLISKLEHIPKENEKAVIEYKGYVFTILSIDNKKIGTVMVQKKKEQDLPTL